ncbi:MAG TPA: hypothetical protein VH678_03985 [Xanthobacteraceae bacterium]|jgi:hypothetical protein
MVDLVPKKQGVLWKRANLSGLSKETRKLYDTYRTDYDKAQASSKTLREALNKEWKGHNPDGKDGKICSFNVIGGAVNYTWVDKTDQVEEGEPLFP